MEKYIITIDGPDCSGKTTLWKNIITKYDKYKHVQIRGIISNIAYALKFNRDVDELIDLYNINPINYVVYLINPITSTKIEMIHNRLKQYSNDEVKLSNELSSLASTFGDYKYFREAVKILKEKYKGDLQILYSTNNNIEPFINAIEDYKMLNLRDIIAPSIKFINEGIDTFEEDAKDLSAFKYIVLFRNMSEDEIIDNLYEGLDPDHKKMFDMILEYTNDTKEDIYDSLYLNTINELVDFLDDYTISVNISGSARIESSIDADINIRDLINYCDIEDYVYDDSNIMDELYDSMANNLKYDSEIDNLSIDIIK